MVYSLWMNYPFSRNSQENIYSRTSHHLESCNRWCRQDRQSSCHNGQPSSSLQLGRGCPQSLGGTTRAERRRLISSPLPAPWGCYTTAVSVSHTSGRQGYKQIRKGSSGACQSSTQPEKGQKAGWQKFIKPTIPKSSHHLHLDMDSSCIPVWSDSKCPGLDIVSHRDIWHRTRRPAEPLRPPGTESSSTSAGEVRQDGKNCSSHFQVFLKLTALTYLENQAAPLPLFCPIDAALLLFICQPWTSHSTEVKAPQTSLYQLSSQGVAHLQASDWPDSCEHLGNDCSKLIW